MMIRTCDDRDFDQILTIINDGAQAYRRIIPSDRWKEPYMSNSELEEKQKRIEFLEKKVQTKGEVLAELMAEHVALKKNTCGTLTGSFSISA